MPNKRNPLPRDCPKCGMKYGTVQMVFFAGRKKPKKSVRGKIREKDERYRPRSKAVIRIGHYDSGGYFEAKKENANVFNDDSEEDKDRKLRTSQRRWCSFRSFVLDDYIGFSLIEKNITKPVSAEVWNRVLEVGWDAH